MRPSIVKRGLAFLLAALMTAAVFPFALQGSASADQCIVGYNMVLYVTQTAEEPHYRMFHSYSINKNYDAYGARPSYGEKHLTKYVTAEQLNNAKRYAPGDKVLTAYPGYNSCYDTAYYFGDADGYVWFIESPVYGYIPGGSVPNGTVSPAGNQGVSPMPPASGGPLTLDEYISGYNPWYYWQKYVNSTFETYSETKYSCADALGVFTFAHESADFFSYVDDRYISPQSNGPEGSPRTIYLKADSSYSKVRLFRDPCGETISWDYRYYNEGSARVTDADHRVVWAGWGGHNAFFDIYFKYPGLVLLQGKSSSGILANVLIVVQ